MKKTEKFTFKEKLSIIKRTISLAEQADKGYANRQMMNFACSTIYGILDVFVLSRVIDHILNGNIRDGFIVLISLLFISHIISVTQDVVINGRYETHNFHFNRNQIMAYDKKLMNMDFIHLENPDKINQFYGALQDLSCVSQVIFYFCYAIGGILDVIVGIAMLTPMVFRSQVETSGFMGFVQSPWGFIAAIVISMTFEIIKTTIFGKKEQSAFAKEKHNKDNILSIRIVQHLKDLVLSNYQAGKDIRLYDQSDLILNRTKAASDSNIKNMKKMWKSVQKFSFMWQFMNVMSRIVMYAFAIARAASGMLTVGEIVGFVCYFGMVQGGISNISEGWGNINLYLIYMKNSQDFLDTPDEKYKGTIPTEKRDDNEYEFEFRNVSFKYPNSDTLVLKNVNLKWKIGEKMALVGKNGCGKSTLVKLLCRLYDPTEGEITLNGIDIRKYSYEDYMALFSVVFQDSDLFSLSVAENVAASTEYDRDKVIECVKRVGLGEWLNEAHSGIETCIGKDFDESGIEISGGEKQKLCLARAIYKGAPFIVLDEPTAALDPISEHEVYTNFNSIVGTRTAIYISHRLSSCRFCDNITVLDNGSIAEQGSHGALISANGVYAEMWAAQAEYYKDTAGTLFA